MAEDDFQRITDLVNSFKAFHKTRAEWMDLIYGVDEINLGKLYHDIGLRYHSVRPMHEWNQYTAMLDTASITYAFQARTEDDIAKQSAQRAEHWFNAVIKIMNEGDSPPLRLSRSRRAATGLAIWKFDIRPSWFKDGKGLPFIWSEIPPATCAWFKDAGKWPELMVEQAQRPLNPMLRAFNLKEEGGTFHQLGPGQPVDSTASGYLKTVKVTQVSTPETIEFWLQSIGEDGEGKPQLVWNRPNPWQMVPYVIVPALLTANTADLSNQFQPLLYNTLTMASYENYMKSLVFLAARLTAAPIYDVVYEKTGQPYIDPETSQPMVIEVDPDKPMKYPLPEGATLKQRTIEMGIDNDKMLAVIEQAADQVGFPTALLGEAPQPRTPAYAYAEARGAASVFIDPATRAEEAALIQVQELLGNCIKNYIGKEIPIQARMEGETGEAKTISIGPDDIGEHDVSVGVSVPVTSLQLAKQEMMRKDRESGDLSQETYMSEGMGIKDVTRELRLIDNGDLRAGLKPSLQNAALELAEVLAEAELKMPVRFRPAVPPPAAAPTGKTRPAEQIRPVESQPNPIEQGVV